MVDEATEPPDVPLYPDTGGAAAGAPMSRAADAIAAALAALREERDQLDQAIAAIEAAAGVKRRGRKPGRKPGPKPGRKPGRPPGRPKKEPAPPEPKIRRIPRGVSGRPE